MMNLIRIALLTFAFGIFAFPLLDSKGVLEEYAFAMAEDAANQDIYLALTQFSHPSGQHGNGPLPQPAALTSSSEKTAVHLPAACAPRVAAAKRSFSRRPLYLLYHNLRFYDCMA